MEPGKTAAPALWSEKWNRVLFSPWQAGDGAAVGRGNGPRLGIEPGARLGAELGAVGRMVAGATGEPVGLSTTRPAVQPGHRAGSLRTDGLLELGPCIATPTVSQLPDLAATTAALSQSLRQPK